MNLTSGQTYETGKVSCARGTIRRFGLSFTGKGPPLNHALSPRPRPNETETDERRHDHGAPHSCADPADPEVDRRPDCGAAHVRIKK